ncbi:MAG: FkbM family methyltransferase [Actinobacteria bacterium]|nr:MAG: FkbM family methyltransferase [Actinomycetota bacterium]
MRAFVRGMLLPSLHRYPLVRGVSRIGSSGLVKWSFADLPGSVEARLRSGGRVDVDPRDWDGRIAFAFGQGDPALMRLFAAVLEPGDTALDVGANLGVLSLHAAALVGDGGRVVAYEPQPALADALRVAGERSGLASLIVREVALGRTAGAGTLHTEAGHSGKASLVRGDEGGLRVTVVDGAGEMAALGVARPRLMKIDVEGFEMEVFSGLGSWLAETGPDVVVYEIGEDAGDCSRLLSAAGYDVHTIVRTWTDVRFMPFSGDGPPPPEAQDCLAVRRDAAGTGCDWIARRVEAPAAGR